MKRIATAFLLAPIPIAVFQALVVAIWPKPGKGVFENPASMFVVMCLYFYLVELLLGLPLYMLLRKRLPNTAAPYGMVGAVLALIPVGIGLAIAVSRGQLTTYAVSYNLLLFGCGGFLAGIVFWRKVIRLN